MNNFFTVFFAEYVLKFFPVLMSSMPTCRNVKNQYAECATFVTKYWPIHVFWHAIKCHCTVHPAQSFSARHVWKNLKQSTNWMSTCRNVRWNENYKNSKNNVKYRKTISNEFINKTKNYNWLKFQLNNNRKHWTICFFVLFIKFIF